MLIEGNSQRYRLDFKEERRLWEAIERIYMLEPEGRNVSNLASIIGELKERLHRWTHAGHFFRGSLNFDDWRIAGKPKSTQFLDYQVVNSDIDAERDHLVLG